MLRQTGEIRVKFRRVLLPSEVVTSDGTLRPLQTSLCGGQPATFAYGDSQMDFGAGARKLTLGALAISSIMLAGGATPSAAQAAKQPNIVVIMGDDIGMWNIGAYHRGLMAGRTPNLDKMTKEGMLFTDYYAEASCTAGRANFITGQLPIRTGMTTVGQAGAKIGIPAEAVTTATILKSMGYATGQFGKNHLGDRNEFL